MNSEHCNPLRAILTFLQSEASVDGLLEAMESQNSLCGRLSVFCSLYNSLLFQTRQSGFEKYHSGVFNLVNRSELSKVVAASGFIYKEKLNDCGL